MNHPSPRTLIGMTQTFLRLEAAGGVLLVVFGLLAIMVANSPLYGFYDYALNALRFRIGFEDTLGVIALEIRKPVLLWINDGLMAIFFLLVGLEIKREFTAGELSTPARAVLPFLAAAGGMVVPAGMYWLINHYTPENLSGWAIPSATDIAFALGVLSLLGNRIPTGLKVLLMSIAVIDDLGAVIIIALFYGHQAISLGALALAGIIIIGLFALSRARIVAATPYVLLGILLWMALLQSGVHATLAGVITAMFIPSQHPHKPAVSPLEHWVHALHPWVAFGILPLFAFANAGVPFSGMGLHSLGEPVTLGIIAGLFIGKQIGIFGTLFAAIKLRVSPMPTDCNWMQLYGMAILCGIGFTMSLFIGGLAFHDLAHQASIRLGVLTGSLVSAVVGYGVLQVALQKATA
ncbi:MAG: Na+/H+ antiporter NhaA [Alphaproteobacteria bacterium]|nr:Na+/H+ antiporter NhaA [Alphaproteobacteria bacterium]